jgi:hypothetical protein
MNKMKYLLNPRDDLIFKNRTENIKFEKRIITDAISYSHDILEKFVAFEVDVFSILGMRNLSAFIGEIFAASIQKKSEGKFLKNPHQDGYPDLLSMHKDGKELWEKLKNRLDEKNPFSPFKEGGIEIKATCGAVPTPQKCSSLGKKKPGIGDCRIEFLTGYDWKAHHRETNNLVGIVWDFIEKRPVITAVFYSSDLNEQDWGQIIKPKLGGGRTTSVSIMSREGVKKMYHGWLAIYDNDKYIDFFDNYNRSNQLHIFTKT